MKNTRHRRIDRLRERIVRNTILHPDFGCWIWMGRKDAGGYGRITIRVRDGRGHPIPMRVHRVAYEVFRRAIPRGRHVAHHFKCVSPLCCNPWHMRATSQSSNERDKARSRRWRTKHIPTPWMFPAGLKAA